MNEPTTIGKATKKNPMSKLLLCSSPIWYVHTNIKLSLYLHLSLECYIKSLIVLEHHTRLLYLLLLLSPFMCKIYYCNWFGTKLQFSSHMTSSMYKHNMLHTKLSTEFDRFTLNIWKHQNVFRSMTSSFCRFLKMENTQNQCLSWDEE